MVSILASVLHGDILIIIVSLHHGGILDHSLLPVLLLHLHHWCWHGSARCDPRTLAHQEGLLRHPGEVSEAGQQPVLGHRRQLPLESSLVLLALGLGTDEVGVALGVLGLVVLLGEYLLGRPAQAVDQLAQEQSLSALVTRQAGDHPGQRSHTLGHSDGSMVRLHWETLSGIQTVVQPVVADQVLVFVFGLRVARLVNWNYKVV